MSVTVSDLVGEPSLRLTPRTTHCMIANRPISWVSTTELPDPEPFLRGGELVMTTGLQERSDDEWRELIAALAALPVAAVCFGTGLVRQDVPGVVVDAAEAEGLALVESPSEVPFIQISRWVADQIFSEQYAAVRSAVTVQDELVRALLAGDGLRGLLSKLYRHLGGVPVAMVEAGGRVVAQYPLRVPWEPSLDPLSGATTQHESRFPVEIDQVVVGYLCTVDPTGQDEVLSFAASIVGLELARHQAVLTGRRELAGQVVEDIVHRVISDSEARRRLSGLRLSLDSPHRLVIASLKVSSEQLQRLPWALAQLAERRDDQYVTAVIEDSVAVIIDGDTDADTVASDLANRLALIDPQVGVGIGQPRRGIAGLRVSYFEARQACRKGPGVQHVAPLSVTGLLMGNMELPLRDLGETVLAPLLRYDAEHRTDLLATLRSYLDNDCSPTRTAQELMVHRNSLRYRLQLIDQLTERDLSRMPDRIELWFALAALRAEPAAADDPSALE